MLRSNNSLWLFLSVVPRVFRPVMCLDSLKILRILNIWAALAMYSREYCEDSWLRISETKNGRIPRRSIIFKNERINSNFDGDTTNLMRNSSVNQPTKIASVDRKK